MAGNNAIYLKIVPILEQPGFGKAKRVIGLHFSMSFRAFKPPKLPEQLCF